MAPRRSPLGTTSNRQSRFPDCMSCATTSPFASIAKIRPPPTTGDAVSRRSREEPAPTLARHRREGAASPMARWCIALVAVPPASASNPRWRTAAGGAPAHPGCPGSGLKGAARAKAPRCALPSRGRRYIGAKRSTAGGKQKARRSRRRAQMRRNEAAAPGSGASANEEAAAGACPQPSPPITPQKAPRRARPNAARSGRGHRPGPPRRRPCLRQRRRI